jgi:predicted nucleic acid-binding protein
VSIVYLDTSALTKLVRIEAETEGLRRWLEQGTATHLVSSEIATVELVRAARRSGESAVPVARQVLAGLSLVSLTSEMLQRAAQLEPPELRSLDAIHLATALELGSELATLVAYDRRMLAAADALGLSVAAPD